MAKKTSEIPFCDEFSIRKRYDVPMHLFHGFLQKESTARKLHYHDYCEISISLGGCTIFLETSSNHLLQPGDITIIPAGCPHFSITYPGENCEWLWSYFDFADLLSREFAEGKFQELQCFLAGRESIVIKKNQKNNIGKVLELALNHGCPGDSTFAYACGIIMSNELTKILPDPQNISGPGTCLRSQWQFSRLAPAFEYFHSSFNEKISLQEAAEKCFMSYTNFRREFYKLCGLPPLVYIQDLRCSMAAHLLKNTAEPVSQIALQCGFDTFSSFNRQFRRKFGTPPSVYRRGL